MKLKKTVSIVCFVISCILLAAFLVAFVLFLAQTSRNAPSFAEAAKNVLLFFHSIFYAVVWLALGAVIAGVSIKLSIDDRLRLYGRRLFVAELILFFITAGVIATMYVIV